MPLSPLVLWERRHARCRRQRRCLPRTRRVFAYFTTAERSDALGARPSPRSPPAGRALVPPGRGHLRGSGSAVSAYAAGDRRERSAGQGHDADADKSSAASAGLCLRSQKQARQCAATVGGVPMS